jgi:Putative peptidoglycan binding domain
VEYRSLIIKRLIDVRKLFIWAVWLAAVSIQTTNAQSSGPSTKGNAPSGNVNARPARPRPPAQRQQAVVRMPGTRTTPMTTMSYTVALRRYHHERHPRFWWRQHFTTIVLAGGGYYYLDAGYWFPAWGYDPVYEYYDYDGPIYTYGNLLPDQVILNVQRALTEEGYYAGALTGSLTAPTRQAIANYQQDAGLFVTGVIDTPTVAALGLE